jgi:DNA-binding response OmpR family regulator
MAQKRKWKVLVIDDDATAIKVLTKWLNSAGRDVIDASDAQIGFEKAISEQPDLILLDLMLPDNSGVEVARRLQNHTQACEIPIIFMTMCIGVENDKGNEELDVDGVKYRAFAKPLHQAKLLAEVRKTINRRLNQ